jgi:hypothetical protein
VPLRLGRQPFRSFGSRYDRRSEGKGFQDFKAGPAALEKRDNTGLAGSYQGTNILDIAGKPDAFQPGWLALD